MGLHDQIRLRRMALGLSQEELAARVSEIQGLKSPLSHQAVQHWESGANAPRGARLRVLADLFGCSINELYGMPAHPPSAPLQSGPSWRDVALNVAEQLDSIEDSRAFHAFVTLIDRAYAREMAKHQADTGSSADTKRIDQGPIDTQ